MGIIYIYRHRRNDTNQIFYVGIGIKNRPYDKNGRNTYWNHVVKKHGYSVEIIAEVDTWELACELEQFLIQEYGRRDLGLGNLVNLTDGGEGGLGRICTEETKLKMSLVKKGKPSPNKGKKMSEEQKVKISEAMKGDLNPFYNKNHTEETKKKMSESKKGHKLSEETKTKIAEATKGEKHYRAKKVICTITGFIWDSIKECANDNNINYSTLRDSLNGRLKNKTNFKYL